MAEFRDAQRALIERSMHACTHYASIILGMIGMSMILYLTECLTVLLEYFKFQKLKTDLLVSYLVTVQNEISILCNCFT